MDTDMDVNEMDHGESDDTNGDGEGVWSPDIEQCFREALLLFPPCGRRKHILHEEGGGKMYGRNELIARHIMMRTGKSRTRKQVSSHIQVLARRRAKAEAASGTGVSPSPSGVRQQAQPITGHEQTPSSDPPKQPPGYYVDVWMDRPIVTRKIRLVEFSAFIEHRNFQSTNGASIGPTPSTIQQQTTTNSLDNSGLLMTAETDLGLQATQQSTHAIQPYPAPQQQVAHPLTSNHQLPAQFNQASYQVNSQLLPNQHQRSHSSQSQDDHCLVSGNHLQQTQPLTSSGLVRHSYIQIDYTQTHSRQVNKLERVDISQIHDKFPEIGGSEGLFQRGPSDAFFLVKFWADLNNDHDYNIDDQNSYFGFSSHFETIHPYKDITCSTKACSFGLQVVEKVEKIYGALNSSNGRFSYDLNRSPMCEFMIQFIKKLRRLPRASQMNNVLENFTVLQVITSESTSEILLCLAYVFEVASADQNNGPQHHVYKLTRD